MTDNLNEEIKQALMRDVDLSEEEYRAKNEAADASTKAHGVKGRAALTETTRHKRIQMNFYGTALNIMVGILAEASETNRLLRYLIAQGAKGGDDGKRTDGERHE